LLAWVTFKKEEEEEEGGEEEKDCANLLNNSKIKIEIHGVGLVHD